MDLVSRRKTKLSTMASLSFKDVNEEVEYWRRMAEEYKQAMEEAREELEDFQISSRELERELEIQLGQLEKQNEALILSNEKLISERDQLRERLDSGQNTANSELTKLQEELARYKNEKEQQQRYIREMEQRNDDLERANRATVVSLEAFELQLNEAIEHNAILENELDEKKDLIVTVQRLKDETRDLQQELAVIRRQPASHSASFSNGHLTDDSAPSKHSTEIMVQTEPYSVPAPLLTPSTRIAALNMVNDALQKIGHLELKLSQLYRSYGAPPLSAPPNAFVPPALPGSPFGGTVNGGSGKLPSSHSYQRRSSLRSWTNGSLLMDHPAAQSEAHDSSLRVIE
ncbi:hypothetical protein CRM22_001214 [Opisthorchis felineus]|uniref:NUDE domain-containing protein n=2 Tax=Opisthorchis felineus TaxID=147828 RepID=A0A4S2MBU4_OPIFE|nr:hypothetical protein CRM22_001214 [Opisthorchis felineus]